MWQISKLICLLIGNRIKWIYYAGKKPIKEVAKEDNEIIGFVILILLFFFLYSFNKSKT